MLTFLEPSCQALFRTHTASRSMVPTLCGAGAGTTVVRKEEIEAQDLKGPTAATRLVKAELRFKPRQFNSGATFYKPALTHTPHFVGSVSKCIPSETVSLMVLSLAVPLVWASTTGHSVRLSSHSWGPGVCS